METEYKITTDAVPRRQSPIGIVGTFATLGGFACETVARLASYLGWDLPLGWIDGMWLGAGLGLALALGRRKRKPRTPA